MARKVGQIIARGDRRWLIRVYLGRDHETKKRNYHNRTIHGRMREAQAYLTKKLRERDLGRDLEGAKITLNEYLDRWLETAVKPEYDRRPARTMTACCDRYIRPGSRRKSSGCTAPSGPSNHLSANDRARPVRSDRPLHACGIKVCDAAGIAVASVARESCRWRQNPAAGQRRNACRSPVEQAQDISQGCTGTPHGPVLAVALTTGMRPSEYLGLKWQDIDWARQTVSVVRSIRRLDGRWCFSDTKRSRSRRPIKLQSWIVALLRDLQTKASAHDLCPEAHDLVFRTSSGQPINADYLAKHFRSILDLAGVPRIRLYDLRHSAATIALAAGVSPKVVSEQLGHASTAFTLDTYAHVLPHMQDEAVARVEAMLFRADGVTNS